MKTKIFSLLLAVAASVGTMYASNTQVDGIWYDFDSSTKTASVTYRGNDPYSYDAEYSGSVVIPASVTYNSVIYSVTRIGDEAFSGCTGLTSVTIPNSVTSIGYRAFAACYSLTSPVYNAHVFAYLPTSYSGAYTIPDGIESIAGGAFAECTGLTSVTIPNSVTSIGDGAFYSCSSLTSPAYNAHVFAFMPTSYSGAYTIPDGIESIAGSAFYDCSGLTSVTIPNSVTSIGETAFYDCPGLTSVTIPNSVTSIGEGAFEGCSGLTSITIPNSVTSIGETAFYDCPGLTSVTLNSNAIVSKNYSKNSNLKTIFGGQVTEYIIGDDVTSIGNCAFYGCSGLTFVTIPNSVTSIGEGAFFSCSGLTSPVYNAHVFAFMPTSYSGAYTIPAGIESIADYAFYSCKGLTSVTIPNSVTSIGDDAFSGCKGLNAVHISDLSAWCNILFPSHNGNTANPLCNAHHLYLNNSEITNLIIPNSITHISANAFNGANNITSVTIPSSVVSIGAAAFEGCYAIRSVTCEGAEPPYIQVQNWYYDEIFRGDWGFNVYVPCGSLEEYKNAQWWKEYASQMRYLPFPYMISQKAVNGYVSFPSIDSLTICDESVQVTAIPDPGCYFVRWADGNTENPRTIELTQDTTMEAIFDYLLEGKCGKDNVLTWTLDTTTMALNITGKGALSENYTYGRFIESLTIGNEVTNIGQWAFGECDYLKNVIIGSSVKVLEEGAFAECPSIESFTCYSQRPPTVNQYALYGLEYSTIVYVPADYLETYKMHDAWGLYDVRPLGAVERETEDVAVTPHDNTAEVVWPAVAGAATYELVIRDKDGNVICTLVFNSNGQLTSIAFAPARDNAPQQTPSSGFAFTVTGLNSGTGYDLTMTSKDSGGATLQTKTVSFTTTGEAQGINQITNDKWEMTNKIIRDGNVLILRGEKVYTVTGQEVK